MGWRFGFRVTPVAGSRSGSQQAQFQRALAETRSPKPSTLLLSVKGISCFCVKGEGSRVNGRESGFGMRAQVGVEAKGLRFWIWGSGLVFRF